MQQTPARYDLIADFHLDVTGADAGDPAAVTLLGLLGDLREKRVLDIACGHGRLTRDLARRGGRVTGFDISAKLLDMAQQAEAADALGITYLLQDIASDSALTGESFDVVCCNHGLADNDDLDGACSPLLDEQAGIDRLDAGRSPKPLPPRGPAPVHPDSRVVLSREPADARSSSR